MSSGNSNLGQVPGSWWRGRENGYFVPAPGSGWDGREDTYGMPGYDSVEPPWGNRRPLWHHVEDFPWPSPRRVPNPRFGAPFMNPFGERAYRRPLGFPSIPLEPYTSPAYHLHDNMTQEANPRPSFATHELPPPYGSETHRHTQTQDVDSKLTREEQEKALKMLKKEVYNPNATKMLPVEASLYYRTVNDPYSKGAVKDDVKSCSICLEDFEPRCEVMVTPCKHMFHEECIVPWVKSQGQCPVCRYAFYERVRDGGLTSNSGYAQPVDSAFANELLWMVSALDEAFSRGRMS